MAADGSIRVMGRQKQIIIRGGRNSDIDEMEATIAGLPGVVQGLPESTWPEYVFTATDLPQIRVGALSRPDAVRSAPHLAELDPSSSQLG